tara:strand:+ start:1520 stop:1627 length:108 start_codon:yes stop_codon:yes gene_type:complete
MKKKKIIKKYTEINVSCKKLLNPSIEDVRHRRREF